jgi:hypothetical protein
VSRRSERMAYAQRSDILNELRVLRELALVAIRFPDLSEEERQLILQRVQERWPL